MIVSNKHPIIAKEGWLNLGICSVLLGVSFFLHSALAIFFILLLCFLVYLYRDPARIIPSIPLGMVSPVDGVILSIDKIKNPYTDEPSVKLTIQKNRLGVFAIRSPIEGKLLKQLHESIGRASRYINWVQTDEGDNILWDAEVRGRTGVHCHVQPGERIGHGQRCGFLLSTASVNLYLPSHSSLNVNISDRVYAGETIVAHIVHNQGASIIARSKGKTE